MWHECPSHYTSPSSRLTVLFILMVLVTTFASNKRFGLVNTGQRRLWRSTTIVTGGESSSAVNPPIHGISYFGPLANQPTNQQTNLLTNTMEHSLSWGANRASVGQEIVSFLRNLKVYNLDSLQQTTCIYSQMNPIHAFPSCFFQTIVVLFSHLCLGLQNDLFLLGFLAIILCVYLFSVDRVAQPV